MWPPRAEIGWESIGEKFTRFFLFKSKWCNVYLHKLNAPNWHPQCHDHPWSFVAFLLWRGYLEQLTDGTTAHRRYPCQILFRRAECRHNVVTSGTSWSLIITGPKRRQWSILACEE